MDAEPTTRRESAAATPPRPEHYRWSIRAAALVAMVTWWGFGLPYSLYAWLLDPKQLHWVLICYAWEVPACGLLGPLLFPLLWFRDIDRRWQLVFAGERVENLLDLGERRVLRFGRQDPSLHLQRRAIGITAELAPTLDEGRVQRTVSDERVRRPRLQRRIQRLETREHATDP